MRSLERALIASPTDGCAAIRVNQLGYLPVSPKVAVLCSLDPDTGVDAFVSTNEPIMDGTANLVWLLSSLGAPGPLPGGEARDPLR